MRLYHFAAVALAAGFTHAYKIDKASCGTDASFIGTAMVEAFDMAHRAVEVIDTPGDQRSANANRLIELLFCSPTEDPVSVDLTRARTVLAGLGSISYEDEAVDTYTEAGAEKEVIVFCGMEDRVEKNARGEWVHKKYQQTLDEMLNQGNAIAECMSGSDLSLAITWNLKATWEPDGTTGFKRREHHASEINLCRWFVEWAKHKRFRNFRDLHLKSGLASLVMPLTTKGYPYTAFDAVNLLDKVLLHELTHTNAAGKPTEDVAQGFENAWPDKVAYGWKNALALANMADNDDGERAQDNADTLALFASGIRLLDLQPPKYVRDDGSLTDTAPVQRRGEMSGEAEPADPLVAFEHFVALIKGMKTNNETVA